MKETVERVHTWLLIEEVLKFIPFIFHRLLHQMRPDAADSKVGHVQFHQVQNSEDCSVGQDRQTNISLKLPEIVLGINTHLT